jgi:hypothetical protein
MQLVDTSPIISDVALEAGKNEYKDLMSYISEWIQQGFIKTLAEELIVQTVWGLCSVIINYCAANDKAEVENEQLEIVWGAICK